MTYSLQHKAIDNLIVMLLVFSSGGLLFAFNDWFNFLNIFFFITLEKRACQVKS